MNKRSLRTISLFLKTTGFGLLFAAIPAQKALSDSVPGVFVSTYAVNRVMVNCTTATLRTMPNSAFEANEALSYIIRWGVVTAGRSSLSVRGIDTIGGRPAYHLDTQARSSALVDAFYHVEDHTEAWLDVKSLTTLRYDKRVHEGHYQIDEQVDFDQPCRRFVERSRRFDKNSYEERQGTLPAGTMDVFGSLYFLRTQPLAEGMTYTVDVYSGDKLWPLEIHVLRRESVKVPAGRFNCWVVEPVLRHPGVFVTKGKKVEVWLTDDDRRMPVRMRSEVTIGHVAAELVKYEGVAVR